MHRIAPLSYEVLVKVFEKTGFTVSRVSGDHLVMTKEGVMRPLVIPKKKSVPVFIIMNNLRAAGLSRDEYLSTLEKL